MKYTAISVIIYTEAGDPFNEVILTSNESSHLMCRGKKEMPPTNEQNHFKVLKKT